MDALDTQNATIDGSVVSNQGGLGGLIGGSLITGQLVINGSGTADSPATWAIGGTQLDGSMQKIDGDTVLTQQPGRDPPLLQPHRWLASGNQVDPEHGEGRPARSPLCY